MKVFVKVSAATLAIALFPFCAVASDGVTQIKFDFQTPPRWGYFEHFWKYGGTGEVECIGYSFLRPHRRPLAIRVTDASGQTFQNSVPQGSEVWYRHEKALAGRWELHFGGAKDGVMHHPIRDFRVLVLGGKDQPNSGEVLVKDVTFRERRPAGVPSVKLSADVYGAKPPETMDVEVKAGTVDCGDGEVEITFRDWNGNLLARQEVSCPTLSSGVVWRTSVPYARPADGVKAVFCDAMLKFGEDKRCVEGPAWTAPLPPLRPGRVEGDVAPWGTGIYFQRFGGSAKSVAKVEKLAAAAKDAGIRWLRDQIVWRQVEREPGCLDFSKYDRIMSIVESNGFHVCMLFGALGKNVTWNDPDFPERYCAALRKAVRRYKGRVVSWEIVNEPNLPWPMDPRWAANYRRLLPMATKVVHEEDPEARTVGCSASGLGEGFIRSLAGEEFDDVSLHPYRRFVDDREFLEDLAKVLGAGRGRKMWITEIGWDVAFPGYAGKRGSEFPVSMHEFASLMARAYMVAASAKGVKAVFGYDFVDDGWEAAGYEYHMGVMYDRVAPKPAYRAIAKVFRHFPSGKPSIDIRGDGVRIFRMGGKCAVWTAGAERRTVAVSPSGIAVANLMDEPAVPRVAGGRALYVVDDRHPLFFDGELSSVEIAEDDGDVR